MRPLSKAVLPLLAVVLAAGFLSSGCAKYVPGRYTMLIVTTDGDSLYVTGETIDTDNQSMTIRSGPNFIVFRAPMRSIRYAVDITYPGVLSGHLAEVKP